VTRRPCARACAIAMGCDSGNYRGATVTATMAMVGARAMAMAIAISGAMHEA